MAALVSLGNQLATITSRSNLDCSSVVGTSLSTSHSLPTRTLVHVLVRATVRRHTQMSYIRLDGSHDDESEGEAVSLETAPPELLLRSELRFVMSSSVLLPSPSHNCG
ncbi:hypothetical protein WMY93_025944 [Mugilogobius chulae]|uniref:Uncharacterized protein n=1 Tax=Mugilogobius chulae TaxID=88201 RepID=A0AAW0N707_9GOBI